MISDSDTESKYYLCADHLLKQMTESNQKYCTVEHNL